jgi:phosphatidylinositol alpha-mannosyltransferase
MRIAMLHADLPNESRGGVAYQVSRLADVLVERGHGVTVFSLSPRPDGCRYAVRQIRGGQLLRSKPGRLLGVAPVFAARRFHEFDVIHAHGDSHFIVRRTQPVVRTFYGSARDEARTAQNRRRRWAQTVQYGAELIARRTATVTVGISRATADATGPLDAIIPCGVNRVLFHPGPKAARPTVLFVGTLGGRKRGSLVVNAFRREVLPRVPEAELWLVADEDVEGPAVRLWRGVSDVQIARLFREAWVFALPSTYEGFGVPYVEAMASGTAVVASAHATAGEVVEPGGGTVAADGALGNAIGDLLLDGPRREAAQLQGLKWSERYDWRQIAQSYEAVYELALKRRARQAA